MWFSTAIRTDQLDVRRELGEKYVNRTRSHRR